MIENLSHVFTLFGLGLVLGLQHALDADHVVSVTTFVSQTRSIRRASLFGLTWGLGHTTTLFLAGLVVLVFKLTIPERLALSFEFLVGIMLVVLGANVLRKVIRGEIHAHEHEHEGALAHTHLHAHRRSPLHARARVSFVVGVIHGLAGSGALVLLVLATVNSALQGLLFIAVFGAGSVVGMLLTTTLMAVPLKWAGSVERFDRPLKMAVGAVSIVLGMVVMYETGIVHLALAG